MDKPAEASRYGMGGIILRKMRSQDDRMPSDHRQPNLFDDPQPDFFGAEPGQPSVFRGDPDRVRGRLEAILAEARAADTMPWTRNDLACLQMIVPQMSRWLPDDEAAQWRFAFEAEVERLAA